MEYYQLGNTCYCNGNAEDAVLSYSKALHEVLSDELRVKVLMNRGQCFLRTEQYNEAINDCSSALNIIGSDQSSAMNDLKYKSLLRRSQAHELIGNYELALLDVESALGGNIPPSLQKTAIANRSRLRSFIVADKKVSQSEGRPVMMVTNQQALRLGFIREPPREIVLGNTFHVRLCIGNELGLWDRSLLLDSTGEERLERPNVSCSLISTISSTLCSSSSSSTAGSRAYEILLTSPQGSVPPSNDLRIGENGKIDLQITVIGAEDPNTLSRGCSSLLEPIAVILRFELDRPLPNSGDVLPLLSLPAVLYQKIPSNPPPTTTSTTTSTATVGLTGLNGVSDVDMNMHPPPGPLEKEVAVSTYQDMLQLCDRVHANCIREITVSLGTAEETNELDLNKTANKSTDALSSKSSASIASTVSTAEEEGEEKRTQKNRRKTLTVYALESPGYLGIAGKVWDSMYVLLQYLSHHTDRLVRNKTIIELGCGTGLAGISLCSLNPKSITLTDMDEVLPLIHANVLLNSIMVADPSAQSTLTTRYRPAAYCWGKSLKLSDSISTGSHRNTSKDVSAGERGSVNIVPVGCAVSDAAHNDEAETVPVDAAANAKVPYFDVILASDVVYYPEGYEPLLATLCDLLTANPSHCDIKGDKIPSSSTPVCVLAHRHRHPEDKKFFDALYARNELNVRKLDFKARHAASSATDVQALNDVILFEITRRRETIQKC